MKHALFAGTFDPPTLGHLAVIQKALPLFDKLTVAIAKDTRKNTPLLSVSERISLIKTFYPDNVVELKGLLSDFVKEQGINVLLRGLRTSEDIYHEFTMAEANRQLCGVETLFIMGDPQYAYISGSLVREIANLGGNLDPFLPPQVVNYVQKALGL